MILLDSFVWPPFLGLFYGFISWIVYNLYRLDEASHDFDLDQDGYSIDEIGAYWKKHKLKIIISGLLLVVGILEMPTIWSFVTDKPFSVASYLLAGFLSVALQYVMDKYDKRK